MRPNNEPNPEYDELYAWFLTQEENRPSWVALARRFKPELAHDDPAHESQSDSIRADFTKKRGVLPKRAQAREQRANPETRAERLAQAHPYLAEKCATIGLPIEKTDRYWTKDEDVSVLTVVEKDPVIIGYEEIKKQILDLTQAHAPAYPYINRLPLVDKHLFALDMADPHFGKYASQIETGDGYSLKKAEERFALGTEGLIKKATPYPIERIVFIGGNDVVHVDGPQNTTTGGTRQDVDSIWHEIFMAAFRANIGSIDRLLELAPVHVVFCPSNHDFATGFYLFQNLKSWYRNCKDVTFDASISHRKYVQYGNSLIGCSHGDGAKEADLPNLMMTEAKAAWAKSKYAWWLVHHRHHKDKKAKRGTQNIAVEKDHIGVTVLHAGYDLEAEDYCYVEYVRSMSGTDSWHHRNGYQHAKKAAEGFLFHPSEGQVGKINHLF